MWRLYASPYLSLRFTELVKQSRAATASLAMQKLNPKSRLNVERERHKKNKKIKRGETTANRRVFFFCCVMQLQRARWTAMHMARLSFRYQPYWLKATTAARKRRFLFFSLFDAFFQGSLTLAAGRYLLIVALWEAILAFQIARRTKKSKQHPAIGAVQSFASPWLFYR